MLTLETPGEGVALLRYERPEARNALSAAIRSDIADRLEELDANDDIRAIVFTGTEKAFAAGADLAEMADTGPVEMLNRNTGAVWDRIAGISKPLIAAVRGFALGGGCELAMHCDIIIAGEGATFGQPEPKVGLMPGGGGTQRLVRAVGKFRANLYLMTGRLFDAPTALEMGLISEVVADDKVVETALEVAREIALLPPVALKSIKQAVRMADSTPLDQALAFERKAFQFLFATDDKREGIAAFLEKRKPVFTGR